MYDSSITIDFWPDARRRDFVVISPLHPLEYPQHLCAVGAARSGNTFIVVPLVELTTPRGALSRQPLLWIPPAPGILTFKAPRNGSINGTETARQLRAFLDIVGVEAAFLHADSRGEPDTNHEGALATDIRTGRKLFRPLGRFSPVNGRPWLERMVIEAYDFMLEPVIGDPDDLMQAPPLLAAHVRAVCAAADGAARTVLEYQARTRQRPTTNGNLA